MAPGTRRQLMDGEPFQLHTVQVASMVPGSSTSQTTHNLSKILGTHEHKHNRKQKGTEKYNENYNMSFFKKNQIQGSEYFEF